MVSRTWNRLCQTDILWKRLYPQAPFASTLCPWTKLGSLLDESACSRSPSFAAVCEQQDAPDLLWYDRYKTSVQLHRNWSWGSCRQLELPHPAHAAESHTDAVYAVQLCGRYLVTGSLDRSIRIWNVETQRLVGSPLHGHSDGIVCLHVNPDHDIIASGGTLGDLVIWKFSSQEMVRRIRHVGGGTLVAIKVNALYIVTSSADQVLRIWQLATLRKSDEGIGAAPVQPWKAFTGHSGRVTAIDVSGDTLVSVSSDNTVRVWHIPSSTCIKTLQEPRSLACVSLTGGTIVCAGTDQSIALYDSQLHSPPTRLEGHEALVRAVKAHIDSRSLQRIASGSYDGTVRLWAKSAGRAWESFVLGPIGGSPSLVKRPGRRARQDKDDTGLSQRQATTSTAEDDSSSRTQDRNPTVTAASVFGIDMDDSRLVCRANKPVIFLWDFTGKNSNGCDVKRKQAHVV